MSNEILNSLLKEYEQKKLNAEMDLDRRKQNLYKLIPRLEEIDNELNNYAINTAKNILNNSSDSNSINNLKQRIADLKKEKELILIQNGYSLNYLKPFYECKICNDTGFTTDNNYNTTMCNCLKQKLLDISFNKSNMSNLNKENFNNFNELIFSDEVDLAKYKFNISPRKNISNIKNKSIDFVNNFDNPEYKNLLFVGSTGLR
jgi:DNA replication protein DnaC